MTTSRHIVFDARYIRIGHHDGISRFSAQLAAQLAKRVAQREDLRLTVLVSQEGQRERIPFAGNLATVMVSAPTSPREPFIARHVNAISPDVVFSPMQTMGSFGRRYRLVLTVHDLIYYRHPTPPREFNAALRGLWRLYHLSWWPQRWLLSGSDAVVAVSRTTRNLIAQYRLTKRPVFVVPNAAEALTKGPVVDYGHRDQRLVYMGSFMPYKNVETLVRAAELLPEFELHLMSRITPKDQARLLALAPNARVVFHNGCTDEEYGRALCTATALVSASRDEGFGIPLVEAMAAGTPIVVSDIPIFREIGGDAAMYAEVDSPHDFARAIRDLNTRERWSRRSADSLEQAAKFSWAHSAEVLLDVLDDVMNTKPKSNLGKHI